MPGAAIQMQVLGLTVLDGLGGWLVGSEQVSPKALPVNCVVGHAFNSLLDSFQLSN